MFVIRWWYERESCPVRLALFVVNNWALGKCKKFFKSLIQRLNSLFEFRPVRCFLGGSNHAIVRGKLTQNFPISVRLRVALCSAIFEPHFDVVSYLGLVTHSYLHLKVTCESDEHIRPFVPVRRGKRPNELCHLAGRNKAQHLVPYLVQDRYHELNLRRREFVVPFLKTAKLPRSISSLGQNFAFLLKLPSIVHTLFIERAQAFRGAEINQSDLFQRLSREVGVDVNQALLDSFLKDEKVAEINCLAFSETFQMRVSIGH